MNFVGLFVNSNFFDGNLDLLFLGKWLKNRLKTVYVFKPITSIIDSHESRTGNHNLHREKVTNQINLLRNMTQ